MLIDHKVKPDANIKANMFDNTLSKTKDSLQYTKYIGDSNGFMTETQIKETERKEREASKNKKRAFKKPSVTNLVDEMDAEI